MGEIKNVNVSNLYFWLENYRFSKDVKTQEEALEFLSKTKNFVTLKKSINEYGYQENELLTIAIDKTNKKNYIVYDGNRRLAAIKKLKIKKLNAYVESDTNFLNAIIDRKHANNSAGTLKWSSADIARRDKAKIEQELMQWDNANRYLKSFLLLEKSNINDHQTFPLTTLSRLNTDYTCKKLDIQINGIHEVKIGKKKYFDRMIDDLDKKLLNSRNLNTTENQEKYIDNLISGKSQKERTNLKDDGTDDDMSDDEAIGRLFKSNSQELEIIEQYIGNNNNQFITEIKLAPVKKYPTLLLLATRAILDSIYNKKKNTENAMPANALDEIIKESSLHKNSTIRDIKNLVNNLAQYAHQLHKPQRANKGIIENNRPIVEIILSTIHEMKKSNSRNNIKHHT